MDMHYKADEIRMEQKLDEILRRLDRLENPQLKTERPKDLELFGQIFFEDFVQVSTWAEFERPFDNVRAIFDRDTGNLKYIGLIDDLPF